MKNEIYDNMLSAYDVATEQQKRNAIFEVNQQVILAGLYNGGFFDVAAFYGGTCLRIFHGLQRFSEDMDFSLLAPDDKFDFTKYFQPIIDEFAIVGREVEIKKKDKKGFGKVESAFLKDNTDVYDVSFQTDKSIKIKIEVDTQPPLNFRTEQKLLLQPHSFMTRCFTLPDLFAGKMHALVYRGWKNRVKGRDWYDFEWYVRPSRRACTPVQQCRNRAGGVHDPIERQIGFSEYQSGKERCPSVCQESQGTRHMVKRLFCPIGGYDEV